MKGHRAIAMLKDAPTGSTPPRCRGAACTRWIGLLTLLAAGCHQDHAQSMLHPASSASAHIAWLWWVLFGVCATVFVVVMLLLALAIFRRPAAPPRQSPLGNKFIIISGIVLPAIILTALVVVTVRAQVALEMPETELTVRVVGHMWWWEVHYPDQQIIIANEIYIPVGQPVRVELISADVVHSLWVPNLQGKMDLLPDKTNVTWLQSDRPGTFRGICAEYCGVQHAQMGLVVVALPRPEFDAWVDQRQQSAERQQAAPVPADETLRRGQQVFVASACHNCHAIAGTAAVGSRGPDLTHLGSRQTLGAGILPNNRGNLSGWISNPQALKPGNLMPRTHIAPDDFHALLEYLESLE